MTKQRRTAAPPAQPMPGGRMAAAALALGVGLWWLWPGSDPAAPAAPARHAGTAHVAHAGGFPAPGATGRDLARSTFPWERLSGAIDDDAAATPLADGDPRTHNAAIDPARLSVHQPLAARALLDHVALAPEPRGGLVVRAVLPGSRYEQAGLRVGDVIHSLDLPGQPPVEETLVSLMLARSLTLEVVRDSALVRLSVPLGNAPQAPA
ncbi:hypothetical protein [Paracidovorax sp. MALMAid1276]|uniref:hypothetical protein n=1 Tax=Paracidovorax sp. MALMAid1276 TaxID=3411631 RepID=UPI003B9D7E38